MKITNANGERKAHRPSHARARCMGNLFVSFFSLRKVLRTSEMNVNFKLETFILFDVALQHSKRSQKLKKKTKSRDLENCPCRFFKTCLFQPDSI